MVIKIVNSKKPFREEVISTGEYHKKYIINKTAYVNSYSYIRLNIIVILFSLHFHIFIYFLRKRNTKLKNIYS